MMRFLMIVMVLFSVVACERVQQTDKEVPPPQPLANGQISLPIIEIEAKNGKHRVTVEVAKSDEERAKGLQGRESLPRDNGMWFIFENDVQDRFWMKDTRIPLDIIFVGSDLKIVDIIANTVPESTELLSAKSPYRYVLEVNAGYAATKGVAIGDIVSGPKLD